MFGISPKLTNHDKPMWLVPAGALFGGSQYSHHQLAYYPCSYEVKRWVGHMKIETRRVNPMDSLVVTRTLILRYKWWEITHILNTKPAKLPINTHGLIFVYTTYTHIAVLYTTLYWYIHRMTSEFLCKQSVKTWRSGKHWKHIRGSSFTLGQNQLSYDTWLCLKIVYPISP